MKGFQFIVWNITYDRVFLNDDTHNGDVFIIVFKSDGPVINY